MLAKRKNGRIFYVRPKLRVNFLSAWNENENIDKNCCTWFSNIFQFFFMFSEFQVFDLNINFSEMHDMKLLVCWPASPHVQNNTSKLKFLNYRARLRSDEWGDLDFPSHVGRSTISWNLDHICSSFSHSSSAHSSGKFEFLFEVDRFITNSQFILLW